MQGEKKKRCINLDWLEVYCLESNDRYPCDADYFMRKGYLVQVREYGTRQYNQMFTIMDDKGDPWIEIRRDPASGDSKFCGLVPQSCHIRLVNRQCYLTGAVTKLRDFLATHDYIFKRIFRIDICHDFEKFDTGDDPEKFIKRYLSKKYTKINQCNVATHGNDNWSDFEWETISWGSQKSMVSTKLYNKTKELSVNKTDKAYIKWAWYDAGLITNPLHMTKVNKNGVEYHPTIWRLEFSLKSLADNWIVIEDQSGKRMKKKAVPHRLSLFDSEEKLWERFRDLSFHYFRFKKLEQGQRKDRCPDKVLYRWDIPNEFMKVTQLPLDSKPRSDEEILKKRLLHYKLEHDKTEIQRACNVLIEEIDRAELLRISPREKWKDFETLRLALMTKLSMPDADAAQVLAEIRSLVEEGDIF